MANLLPSTTLGKIEFYENHIAPWTTNVTAVGLVIGDVTAVGTAAAAARASYTAQQLAQQAAKSATLDLETKLRILQAAGSSAIQKIRGKATGSGSGADAVYVLAQIPAPAIPTPVGAPGTPSDLKVVLNPDGSLTLGWKCANPAGSTGTIYNLRRKLAGAPDFTVLGGAGARTFIDQTIPAGTASAIYEITAVRSTAAGMAQQFVVNFGTTGGEMMASVVTAPKLAA